MTPGWPQPSTSTCGMGPKISSELQRLQRLDISSMAGPEKTTTKCHIVRVCRTTLGSETFLTAKYAADDGYWGAAVYFSQMSSYSQDYAERAGNTKKVGCLEWAVV